MTVFSGLYLSAVMIKMDIYMLHINEMEGQYRQRAKLAVAWWPGAPLFKLRPPQLDFHGPQWATTLTTTCLVWNTIQCAVIFLIGFLSPWLSP